MEALNAVDLFAGPGGWDEGLLELGIRPLGVEWDDAACQTRRAAGHATLQADVALLDPAELVPAGGHVDLLIGSPPCPTFSAAGGGSGHQVVDVILECLDALRDGRDERAPAREKAYEALLPGAVEDERASAEKKNRPFSLARAQEKARRNATMSLLVVEPFRFALELRPRWIALEQVPPVLPIWQRLAADLRQHGWNVWTGLLSSEQYGVPQTRERAILLADVERAARAPAPTHQRYVPPRKEPDVERLFEPGRRERIVVRGEEHLEPWVSMAQALGWVADERPSRTVCGHHTPRWLYGEQDPREGISVLTRGEDGSRPNDVYDATERPSRALTGRAYSVIAEGVDPENVELVNGNQPNAARRSPDEPAPTMHFGHASADVAWVQRERSGDRAEEGFAPDEAPSQTLTSKARSWSVRTSYGEPHRGPEAGSPTPEFDPEERPSRTVVGKAASWELLDERSPEFNRGPVDPEEQPAPTVSSTSRQWSVRTGDNSRAAGGETVPFERDLDAPAPTLTAKVADAWTVDRPSPTIVGGRRSRDGMLAGRQLPPGEGENVGGWGYERPATVVAGDRRLHPPGHKENAQDPPGTFEQRRGENAVRLSVAEASILQGFRPDYPWQGSRTKQFEQVGNAVPPPLARACVRALVA